MSHICFSGGATGSDLLWSFESIKKGYKVIDFSFEGHTTKSENRYILSTNHLKEGYEHIKIANNTLNRNVTNISSYVKNLISRDWFQVKKSEAIFAIGILQTEKTVLGGTGWAVQLAIDNHKPVYLFEQNVNQWHYFDYESNAFEIYEGIPKLTEKFAGIGTRNINENGMNAIISLFKD